MHNLKISLCDNPEYAILKGSIFNIQNIEKSIIANFFKTWYLFSNMILEGPFSNSLIIH